MRIHTDTLTVEHLEQAIEGMEHIIVRYTRRRSRQRARGYDVQLINDTDEYTLVTWDEWGLFISELFRIDPDAIIGQYINRATFLETTFSRFETLEVADVHDHTWMDSATTAGLRECVECGAQFNWGLMRETYNAQK